MPCGLTYVCQSFRFHQLNETEKAPFQHLLHALQCGAPPHGGIALGIPWRFLLLKKGPLISM